MSRRRRDLDPEQMTPDPRVLLSLERTLLAWVRTALAFMGFGFVVGRFGLFLEQSATPGQPAEVELSRWLGTGLVVLGVVVQGLALWDYRHQLTRLTRGAPILPNRWSPSAILATVLVGIGVGMAVYLASF